MSETTKKCPVCGNTNLILLTTSNMKVCVDHKEFVRIQWVLSDGQKPLLTQ